MAYPATAEPMSAREFLDWEEKQPEKHEFIHGEILAMVGVTRQHATVTGNLFSWLMQRLRGARCRAYMADMKLKLATADAFFYPDVFVTCSEADHQQERYMTGAPASLDPPHDFTRRKLRGSRYQDVHMIFADHPFADPNLERVAGLTRF